MALKIAVASGKGGTGKTTVSANLFRYFDQEYAGQVVLADCDVEEPNAALFFPDTKNGKSLPVNQELPVIDTDQCTFCRKCVDYCEFNAILVIPPVKFAEINPKLCHSCGACTVACTHNAIWIKNEPIGLINHYKTENGGLIIDGTLKIGSAMQTMVIRKLKKSLPPDIDVLFLDAPPGTSCPVVETISQVDYVVLVTEPTPFGLHDLKLVISLVQEMGYPFGVVINKSTLGTRDVYDYLEKHHIEILSEIPFNEAYASLNAQGKLFEDIPGQVENAFNALAEKLMKMANAS